MSVNIYPDATVGGGAEKTRETLLRALQDAGHDVVGVATSAEPGIEVYEHGGIRRWRVGLWNLYWPRTDFTPPAWKRRLWHLIDIYNWPMRRRLGQILDSEKPDAVILHNLPGWSISAVSAVRKRGIPLIQVLHDHYNVCPKTTMFKKNRNCVGQCLECRLMRAPHRWLTNRVDAVVGISRYSLDIHLAYGAYGKVAIKKIIHNVRSAAMLNLAQAPALRAKALSERRNVSIRFGFIGTLGFYKGVELLLEAFTALNDPQAELWIAGSGKPEYVFYLKNRFPSPQIKYIGQTTQVEFFTGIDVTVFPSLWAEPLGMVVPESFAFGVPVIASLRGGIPELIVDGETGWLFDPDENSSLVVLLRRAAEDRSSLERMSQQALFAGAAFLNTDAWQASYCHAIERVITANRSPSEAQKRPVVGP